MEEESETTAGTVSGIGVVFTLLVIMGGLEEDSIVLGNSCN